MGRNSWYFSCTRIYGDPIRLGYKGLGEIAIALGFGPVMVMGAHYALTSPLHNNNLSSWNWVEAHSFCSNWNISYVDCMD